MVPGWARAQCSIVRLARGRGSLSGQRMADILILPLSGWGPSCPTEPCVFRIVDPQGRIDFRGTP